MSCRKAVICRLCLLFLPAMLVPLPGRADDFRLLPSISQELRYNDNVFFASSEKTRDFTSYTIGGLQLLDKTERLDLGMSAQLAQSLYKDSTSLNSTDVLSSGTARYSLTPKLFLSGRAAYTRDSQPDREIQTTGLVLSGVRREHETFGAGVDYNLTEKTLASFSYDHGADHYGKSPNTALSNLSYDTATLAFQHDLSKYLPSTKGLLNLGYTQYSLTSVDVKNYEATTGVSYDLREKWSVQVSGGVRKTETSLTTTDFIPAGTLITTPFGLATTTSDLTIEQKTSQSGWGGVGQASLNYTGEVTSASFTASRDIAPASGQNGTVERTSFIFSANRRLSYEFQGLFSASYFINKSKGGLSPIPVDYQTYNVSPGVRYEFNRDMFLEGSYTFTRVENNQAGTAANRSLFLVRFFVQHAIME